MLTIQWHALFNYSILFVFLGLSSSSSFSLVSFLAHLCRFWFWFLSVTQQQFKISKFLAFVWLSRIFLYADHSAVFFLENRLFRVLLISCVLLRAMTFVDFFLLPKKHWLLEPIAFLFSCYINGTAFSENIVWLKFHHNIFFFLFRFVPLASSLNCKQTLFVKIFWISFLLFLLFLLLISSFLLQENGRSDRRICWEWSITTMDRVRLSFWCIKWYKGLEFKKVYRNLSVDISSEDLHLSLARGLKIELLSSSNV